MLKTASCMYCLNKDISIAFNIFSISFKCAYNCGVIFYGNSLEEIECLIQLIIVIRRVLLSDIILTQ